MPQGNNDHDIVLTTGHAISSIIIALAVALIIYSIGGIQSHTYY